jgi:hypothetical protein
MKVNVVVFGIASVVMVVYTGGWMIASGGPPSGGMLGDMMLVGNLLFRAVLTSIAISGLTISISLAQRP